MTGAVLCSLNVTPIGTSYRAAKHPTASAPGAHASGRGWAFAFGAYLACYLIWFFVVFVGYAEFCRGS